MNLEIHQPRLEALIQQRMASGRYKSIEDALVQALESAPPAEAQDGFGKKLIDTCARVNDLTADLDFSRDVSTDRPLDLS